MFFARRCVAKVQSTLDAQMEPAVVNGSVHTARKERSCVRIGVVASSVGWAK